MVTTVVTTGSWFGNFRVTNTILFVIDKLFVKHLLPIELAIGLHEHFRTLKGKHLKVVAERVFGISISLGSIRVCFI